GFGIGSGVPKLHPTSVQSGAVLLTGGANEGGAVVQLEAGQLSANKLGAPSSVRASGVGKPPPATLFRPPHGRFLMRMLLPSSVWPQTPPGVPVVNSRNAVMVVLVVVVPKMVVVVVVEVIEQSNFWMRALPDSAT